MGICLIISVQITALIGYDVRIESAWFCKANNALGYTISDFSVWLLVLVTCERFIVVCFPLRASAICQRSISRVLVLIFFIVFLSVNCHLFWTADVVSDKSNRRCGGTPEFESLVDRAWPWVDAALYSLLPFIIIAIFNSIIICKVMAATRRRKELCYQRHNDGSVAYGVKSQYRKTPSTSSAPLTSTATTSSSDGDNTRLTVMLLVVTFTFLATTLPMIVVSIAGAFFWKLQGQSLATFSLVRTICMLLMYVNHSINFFLYCATGQKFRRQLALLFCGRRRKMGRQGTAATATTVMTIGDCTPDISTRRHVSSSHKISQVSVLKIDDTRMPMLSMHNRAASDEEQGL